MKVKGFGRLWLLKCDGSVKPERVFQKISGRSREDLARTHNSSTTTKQLFTEVKFKKY